LEKLHLFNWQSLVQQWLWLAADPVGEQETGGYWDAPNVKAKANKNAYNAETQKRLWAVSTLLTGV